MVTLYFRAGDIYDGDRNSIKHQGQVEDNWPSTESDSAELD